MKPYTPAVHGVKGLPGPTGWGIYREAAFPLRLSLDWITPVPNRSCLSSRVRRTLKPAHTVLVARYMVSCQIRSHWQAEPARGDGHVFPD